MERKYKSKLVGLALVGTLIFSGGCATSSKSYNPNSQEGYSHIPQESKENYKAGPGTSCLGNALIFMLHLGGL